VDPKPPREVDELELDALAPDDVELLVPVPLRPVDENAVDTAVGPRLEELVLVRFEPQCQLLQCDERRRHGSLCAAFFCWTAAGGPAGAEAAGCGRQSARGGIM
jgi:hypothetical protein